MANILGGWIAPNRRTTHQRGLAADFDREVKAFGAVGEHLADLPDRVLLYELERKANQNELLPRYWQLTGSCVGFGGGRAYCHSICGDVVIRGDQERVVIPHPLPTYGVGRQIAGMRSTGSGSFGAAQAKAVQSFGMLPSDWPELPQHTIRDGWAVWTKQDELTWSHPKAWPINRSDLERHAKKFAMGNVVRVDSIESAKQLLAQGFGITCASMFGTKARVEGDPPVMLGRRNKRWAHQFTISGFWEHPTLGLLFPSDNQWGAAAHGICPVLDPMGVRGSFWMPGADFKWVIETGEVFAHSNTGGFELRKIDWGNVGIG